MTQKPPVVALASLVTVLALAGDALSRPSDGVTTRQADPPADHVVLISIDGLRPGFYLDPGWPMPMIQQMSRDGAHARRARGVYPTVTYPSHTTILTGALPARHGIYYNSPFEPDGETGRWYWEAEAIQVPTLWDAVRNAGLTSANLSWPVSVGAPVDWNLPEIWSISDEMTSIEALRAASSPSGLWEEIEREATGRLTLDNFDIAHTTRDDRAGDIAAYLLANRKPNLMTVHVFEGDHFQHEDGRESPRVRRAVAAADRAIAQMMEAAERVGILERTAFVVVGDHGFLDIHTRLRPNVWLAEADLQSADRAGGNWRATFHTTAASAFLHLADPEDAEAVERVRRVLESRPEDERALFEILDRKALDAMGAAPEAALALALAPGVTASSSARPPAVGPGSGANHGFPPEIPELHTGFIAWGAGVARGAVLDTIDLVDVAPFVARLLGLDLEPLDGALRPELLAATAEPLAPESQMAGAIDRALGRNIAGERILLRHDDQTLPDLPALLSRRLSDRGARVEALAYGSVEAFERRLAETDVYVWLPYSLMRFTEPEDQIAALAEWTAAGKGRQLHFHWGDGTRSVDGRNAEHTAEYDRIYLDALQIDYAALDRVQQAAELLLRAGTIRVTTPAGTDMTFSIGDRPVTHQNGDASLAATGSAQVPIAREIELPAGALRVAPIESTVSGTLVIPAAWFSSGMVESASLEFREGQVTSWHAESGVEHLEAALTSQPALTWFRELGVGFNPKLVAPDGDDRIPYYGYGTGAVRLSLGNNTELGGNVDGTGVRWMFFPDATVEVGASALVQDGRLTERFRVPAD
jgi:predicted AlkP superfamily pyrophosphatase or phosphodiesterase